MPKKSANARGKEADQNQRSTGALEKHVARVSLCGKHDLQTKIQEPNMGTNIPHHNTQLQYQSRKRELKKT